MITVHWEKREKMARMIDADELMQNNTWLWFDSNGNHTIVGDAIEDAPTVDAVEVVRCKDCRFYASGWCKKWL